jgi:hypothetical protein
MSWWSQWFGTRTPVEQAWSHAEEGRFTEAKGCLADPQDPAQAEARRKIGLYWLQEAVVRTRANDDTKADEFLREGEALGGGPLADEAKLHRRFVRQIRAERDLAVPWARLLRAAGIQERRFYASRTAKRSPRHLLFLDPMAQSMLVSKLDVDGPLTVTHIEEASDELIRSIHGQLALPYGDPLKTEVPSKPEFLRGLLFLAIGRPDRAALSFVESLGEGPVVQFELARNAHALGYPKTGAWALKRFTDHLGKHVFVRNLHTGLFLAQLVAASGKPKKALKILDELGLDQSGRIGLFHARLLKEAGRLDEAEEAVSLGNHEDPEVKALLEEIRKARLEPQNLEELSEEGDDETVDEQAAIDEMGDTGS